MDEQKVLETIKKFAKKLPRFPDGRIDYSNSDIAPVVTVFVKFKDKILLLKRSDKVRAYQNKWNTVAGYLDELKPVRDKGLEELKEELGIEESDISIIHFGTPYKLTDNEISKMWIVHPVLVELKNKPKIKLDWEHIKYQWIKPEELGNFDVVFNLGESLKKALK